MTIVLALQALVAVLAVLFLLEAWMARTETSAETGTDVAPNDDIEFRPELIARWDDETLHAQ